MLTEAQCRVKVSEMDQLALDCPPGQERAAYVVMASHWHRMADAAAREAVRILR